MISISNIRSSTNQIIVLGNHPEIIQSILDFDYLSKHQSPSIIAIVTGRRGVAKYFWGKSEILIPTITSLATYSIPTTKSNLWLLNLYSGRRTLTSTIEFLSLQKTNIAGAALFAENVPELHSLNLINTIHSSQLVVGPASVGLLIPSILKLGPIGGITPDQIEESKLTEMGEVAILSASGGMTNELINIAISAGHRLSFALSFGGDRFPILSPKEAFLLAEKDPATKAILYYGELGGVDEYELVELKQKNKLTKTVIAHIAGTVSSLFPESPQFGHAKAKADNDKVTAVAKRQALDSAGFQTSNSFTDFIKLVNKLKA